MWRIILEALKYLFTYGGAIAIRLWKEKKELSGLLNDVKLLSEDASQLRDIVRLSLLDNKLSLSESRQIIAEALDVLDGLRRIEDRITGKVDLPLSLPRPPLPPGFPNDPEQ